MKPQAHYKKNSKKWLFSFAIMAVISILVAACSTVIMNAVDEKNSKPIDVDFSISNKVSLPTEQNELNVTGVEKAVDASGNVVAYVITSSVTGYNQEVPIVMNTTISADASVVASMEVVSQEETEYLGVRVQSEEFEGQFTGRKLPLKSGASVTKGSSVDLIAKSTVSSKAVLDGVNNAQKYVQEFLIVE